MKTMSRKFPPKNRMPQHLVALVSKSGVIKHVESFPHPGQLESYLSENSAKNRVVLTYCQNCMARENIAPSEEKPPKVFPKPGLYAVLKPGTRFTVFHQDEQLAMNEGSRIAQKEDCAVGLFEVTRVLAKQEAKKERRERRRVRI